MNGCEWWVSILDLNQEISVFARWSGGGGGVDACLLLHGAVLDRPLLDINPAPSNLTGF